jgi:serine phosphatase RsbU (regulator of sigma subunit)
VQQHHEADAAMILEHIVAAVQTFSHGAAQHDDVTALVIKYAG